MIKTNEIGNLAGTVVVPVSSLITPELQAHVAGGGNFPTWDGEPYVDSGAVGANATAKIYPDGTIIGSTDNGEYTKRPDGTLELTLSIVLPSTSIAVVSDTLYNSGVIGGGVMPIVMSSLKYSSKSSDGTPTAEYGSGVFLRDVADHTEIDTLSKWQGFMMTATTVRTVTNFRVYRIKTGTWK